MTCRKSITYLIIFFFINIFASCELINPEEQVPAYIHIDKIDLQITDSEQGSASQKITDAWVYIDDQLIGAFELPVTFPVLWSGTHTITVYAGIKVNGIAQLRAIYPFYAPYLINTKLVPDSIININPLVTYTTSTDFEWSESFEDGGISLVKTIYSDTTLEQTSDSSKVFEGNYSGIIHLDNNKNLFECKTIDSFVLPFSDVPVFLELNYKTNESIYVGIIANTPSGSESRGVLYLNKSDVWNKVYINLKSAVNEYTDATDFQIFFHVEKTDGAQTSEILLDNIKLVHR
ncbi:MAG: hypothetical protein HGB12_11900 [Bacteroidetes bacterium]|nr:hypothetical protein [Bacteroidota bacterium]